MRNVRDVEWMGGWDGGREREGGEAWHGMAWHESVLPYAIRRRIDELEIEIHEKH